MHAHRAALDLYRARTPTSAKFFERAQFVVAGGVSRSTLAFEPYPFYAAGAEGAHVTDLDGNSYIDCVNNYTSLPHGHGHPATLEAATRELSVSSAIGTAHPLEVQYAEYLRERYPAMERMRFTTTGSEATAFAVRVARAATGRKRVLKFEGGFHGSHNELYQDIAVMPALEAGTSTPSRPASAGLEPTVSITAVYNDPESVVDAFNRWGHELAAVIVEPFLGNGSLVTANRPFMDKIFAEAHAAGAQVIFDEVQSLRIGYGGAQEAWGYSPDLVAIGKIMGGGFALAAFGGRAELFDVFGPGGNRVVQTGTFTATPMTLAAGHAAMTALTREVCEELEIRTDRLRAGLRRAATDLGVPVHINGEGSMFDISMSTEPVIDYRTHRAADTVLLDRVRLNLVNDGVLVMPRGTGCLSTAVTDDEVQYVIEAFFRALDAATKG